MNADIAPALELRILSGMHAGARVALKDGAYLIGSQADCDLVLTDEGVLPEHAYLSPQGNGEWEVDWNTAETEDGPAPSSLQPGKAFALGPVIIMIDDPQAEWPTLEQLVLVQHSPAVRAHAEAQDVPSQAPALRWTGRVRQALKRMTVWLLTAGAALASAGALVAWPMDGGKAGSSGKAVPGAGGAAAPASAPASHDSAQKLAIERALAQLGLVGRVKLEPTEQGWLVRAAGMSETEADALAAGLSTVRPRPALRITTEQDLREAVSDAILRLAQEYKGRIAPQYEGEGKFRIDGHLATPAEKDRLAQALAAAVPDVREWNIAVTTGDEAAEKLLAVLRAGGSWELTGQVKDGTLRMDVKLQRSQVRQWEQALVSAVRANPFAFEARLQFPQGGDEPVVAQSEALPFEVRVTVGGDMPYVILQGGQRLSRDGEWHGWRLASIGASQLVFENGARRAVLQR